MSKYKSKKYKRKAHNPTGIPSMKETEINIENFPQTDADSIAEKLKSPCAEDREIGALILANKANNQAFVSNLIEKKIIRVAAPLLIDKSLNVRHAIAGSLRNIAVCNDYTVSEAMVDQDIMTCLHMLFEQYKEPWASVKSEENRIDSKAEIFSEACNLLWTLCENSSTAVSIFNKKNLISILLPCLSVENYDIKIPIAVAHCLLTISENNKTVIDVLMQPLIVDQLKALMSLPSSEQQYLLLKTLAAGIKLNMYNSKLDNCMSDVTQPILKVVSATLSEPLGPMLEDLSSKIAAQKAGRLDKYHEEADLEAELTAVVKAEEALVHILSAKQASLEIIGNIFESGSDDESDYVSSSETGDEMEVEDSTYCTDFEYRLSEGVREIIICDKVWEKVYEQILLPTEEAEKNIGSHPIARDCLKRLSIVRCTALLCLNNMLPKLEIDDIGGPSKLLDLWLNIANILFKKTDMSNIDQVEATTHCMYAVLQKLALAGFTSQFSSMTDLDLELLINVYTVSQDPRIKVHIIGCLGTIGKILCQVKAPTSVNMIKMIGKFLLEVSSKNFDLWVLAEIIDAIIDVFSDDEIDFIAKEINLVEILSRLRFFFEKKFKQQRKFLGERADVIRTAKENLRHFITYKIEYNKK